MEQFSDRVATGGVDDAPLAERDEALMPTSVEEWVCGLLFIGLFIVLLAISDPVSAAHFYRVG